MINSCTCIVTKLKETEKIRIERIQSETGELIYKNLMTRCDSSFTNEDFDS